LYVSTDVAVVSVVILVTNLLKRHPNCRVLLHRPNEDYTFSSDPYDLDEPDPAKACALESCLWELKVKGFQHLESWLAPNQLLWLLADL